LLIKIEGIMLKKTVVGITQRVDKVEPYNEWRDALDQRLVDWVIHAGFLPVPIPNSLVDLTSIYSYQPILDNWLNRVKIDAILLSGGNDIGNIEQRDLTEKYILSWAEKNKKAVLGICRGMQMIGIYMGDSLIEVDGHVKANHTLQIKSRDTQTLPETVNSYHNLALEGCTNTFEILAESEDDNIEAIKHKTLPWEGWMWHPEREKKFAERDQNRFKKLMNSGK